LIVDTSYFRYNASESVAVYGTMSAEIGPGAAQPWQPLLKRSRLQPDTRHEFAVSHAEPVTAIKLDAFPDGGLWRVRVIGSIDQSARRRGGYRWFNSLPVTQAVAVLTDAGMPAEVAAGLVSRRPLAEGWLGGPFTDQSADGDGQADHGLMHALLE